MHGPQRGIHPPCLYPAPQAPPILQNPLSPEPPNIHQSAPENKYYYQHGIIVQSPTIQLHT